jgi:hypothetical protein
MLFLFGKASAQDWQPFNEDRSYFECSDSVLTDEPTISLIPKEIISSSIGELSIINGVIEYKPQKLVGCNVLDANTPCANSMESCSDLFAWNGASIQFQNNGWKAKNRVSHWVNLPSKLDSLIILFSLNDTTFTLQLLFTQQSIIFGDTDSVAHFQISVSDSFGTLSANKWHGDTIRLSKNHGLIKSPSWYLFPKHEAWFQLIDQNGIGALKGLNFNYFYNYSVGTKLETKASFESGYWRPMMGYETIYNKYDVFKQCEVFDSTISTLDTICLRCKVNTKTYHYSDRPNFNGWSQLDSISYKISKSVSLIVNSINAIPPPYLKGDKYLTGNEPFKTLIMDSKGPLYDPSSSCPYHQIEFEPTSGSRTTLLQNIGKIYTSASYLSDPGGGNYNWSSWDVTYFKSDSIEYGSPGWPIGLDEVVTENRVTLFPNPVQTVLHIQSDEPVLSAHIYSISGTLINSFSSQELVQHQLDLSGLASGIYLLQLQLENRTETHRLVK